MTPFYYLLPPLALLAYLAVKRFHSALYLVLALIPAFLLRTQISFGTLSIPTTWLELSIYVLFAVWVVKPRTRSGLVQTLSWACLAGARLLLKPAVLFFLAAIISTIISSDKVHSLGILKGWFLDPFLLFLIFIDTMKTKKEWMYSIYALGASAVWLSLYGIYEYIFKVGLTIPGRLDSIFESPNYFSMYVVPVLVLLTGILASNNIAQPRLLDGQVFRAAIISRTKVLRYIVYILCIVALYLTKSFAGWLALLVGVFLLWLFIPNKKLKLATFFVALIILLPLLSFEYKKTGFKHYNEFFKLTSWQTRTDLWKNSLDLIGEDIIFGVGLGGFKESFAEHVKTSIRPQKRIIDFQNALFPHNLYLNLWLEMGILGLVGFIWIVWVFMRENIKKCREGPARPSVRTGGALSPSATVGSKGPAPHYYSITLIAAMTAILVHGFFDTPYFKNDLSVLFWLLLGLSIVVGRMNKNVAQPF